MSDLDNETLFGEESDAELVRWPAGYGNRPQRVERTLFGELSAWSTRLWPAGYGNGGCSEATV
jgi:hypothetical protein